LAGIADEFKVFPEEVLAEGASDEIS